MWKLLLSKSSKKSIQCLKIYVKHSSVWRVQQKALELMSTQVSSILDSRGFEGTVIVHPRLLRGRLEYLEASTGFKFSVNTTERESCCLTFPSWASFDSMNPDDPCRTIVSFLSLQRANKVRGNGNYQIKKFAPLWHRKNSAKSREEGECDP